MNNIEFYKPCDVFEAIDRFGRRKERAQVTILDPWYNKGIGGIRPDYIPYISKALLRVAPLSDHIYLWGFPEIVALFVPKIPKTHRLTCWLTWYYKNNPSVIRGWRSSQMACLHLSIYPEHFLNDKQHELKANGKLRYMPGPTSVIESSLLVGFVGKKEQTGHPAQKPEAVYRPLVEMTTIPGDLVFDPMCGSGTTGAVCAHLGRRAVLSDVEPKYVKLAKQRVKALLRVQADQASSLASPDSRLKNKTGRNVEPTAELLLL